MGIFNFLSIINWRDSLFSIEFSWLPPQILVDHTCVALFLGSQFFDLFHWSLICLCFRSVSFICFCTTAIPFNDYSFTVQHESRKCDTFQPGGLIFWCHIFLTFHTVCQVVKAKSLEWLAIPYSSGPRFVRTLYYDPSVLSGPNGMAHSLVELQSPFTTTRVWSMELNASLSLHKCKK